MSITIGVVDVPVSPPTDTAPLLRTLPSRRFAGASLLEWVAKRITDVQAVDEIVILLGREHAAFAELAPPQVSVYISERPDPLSRFADLCQHRNADGLVRVSVDTPFVDPVLVDQLICTATQSGCDYATYCSSGGNSAVRAQLGMVAEWVSSKAIAKANQVTLDVTTRTLPTRCVWSRPELFNIKFLPLPKPLDREDLRLVVGSEEDWDHVHQIYDALGPEDLDWQRIAVLLEEQPQIRERMAALNAL